MSTYSSKSLKEKADDLALETVKDINSLLPYLKSLSLFPSYSVNNQLLVPHFSKEATFIKGIKEWEELGVDVNENAKEIYIIEKIKKDTETSFKAKKMIDHTDTSYTYKPKKYNKAQVMEALLSINTNCISVKDNLGGGGRAIFSANEKKILVGKSAKAPIDEFFTAIAKEFVHMKYAQESKEDVYARNPNDIVAFCVAVALAYKYGMRIDNIANKSLGEHYSSSEKESKAFLEEIRGSFNHLNGEITKNLANIYERDKGVVAVERS